MSWTHANLQTQGYRLGGDEPRALRIGLRFPTFCIPSTLLARLDGPRGSNHITSTWPRR
jgi:hypothetical protein